MLYTESGNIPIVIRTRHQKTADASKNIIMSKRKVSNRVKSVPKHLLGTERKTFSKCFKYSITKAIPM